jgi:hypothetical protein
MEIVKNGNTPLFIRISYDGERSEFGIKESVELENWDANKERAIGSSKNCLLINQLLDQYSQRINAIKFLLENEGVKISAKALKDKLVGKK